jgi:hypothetical protein
MNKQDALKWVCRFGTDARNKQDYEEKKLEFT